MTNRIPENGSLLELSLATTFFLIGDPAGRSTKDNKIYGRQNRAAWSASNFEWTFMKRPIRRSWPLSSILLAAAGFTLVIMGMYFILVRPPLLPEDLRYMALPAAQIDAVKPALESWLTRVFQVMGGYVLATGALTITLAATAFRAHHWAAAAGALIGGAASIGWMAYVNFVINSDFKWVLLGMALLWACSLIVFLLEKRTHPS